MHFHYILSICICICLVFAMFSSWYFLIFELWRRLKYKSLSKLFAFIILLPHDITVRHMVLIYYLFIINIILKFPLYNYIDSIVRYYLLAFSLRLLVSYSISTLVNKLFDQLFSKELEFLSISIVECISELSSLFSELGYVCIVATPWGNYLTYTDLIFRHRYRNYLNWKRDQALSRIRMFEVITSAIYRDRSHPSQGRLVDSFREHIASSRAEIDYINKVYRAFNL